MQRSIGIELPIRTSRRRHFFKIILVVEMTSNVSLGDFVEVPAKGVRGVVKFAGKVKFSSGVWIGLEVQKPKLGKNDGSVQGKIKKMNDFNFFFSFFFFFFFFFFFIFFFF